MEKRQTTEETARPWRPNTLLGLEGISCLIIPWTSRGNRLQYQEPSVLVKQVSQPMFVVCRVSHDAAHYRNKEYNQAYGDLLDLNTPNSFKTLMDVFDNGFAISRDFKFLGHRPKLSSNPDKFAPRYVWETYEQVDVRRCAVGSALTTLFESGQIGGGDFKAVGTWSPNRPGT